MPGKVARTRENGALYDCSNCIAPNLRGYLEGLLAPFSDKWIRLDYTIIIIHEGYIRICFLRPTDLLARQSATMQARHEQGPTPAASCTWRATPQHKHHRQPRPGGTAENNHQKNAQSRLSMSTVSYIIFLRCYKMAAPLYNHIVIYIYIFIYLYKLYNIDEYRIMVCKVYA